MPCQLSFPKTRRKLSWCSEEHTDWEGWRDRERKGRKKGRKAGAQIHMSEENFQSRGAGDLLPLEL